MAGKNQVVLTFAGDESKLTQSFAKVGEAAKGMETEVGKASKNIGRDATDGFNRAGEAADNVDTKAMGFRDTMTGVQDTMKGASEIAKGNLFEGFLTLGMGIGDLGSGLYNFLIPSLKGAVTGMRGAATATKAFTLSLLTNPVFLIGAAIAALVVGLVILYKRSETARDIMNTAFSVIGQAVIGMAKFAVQAYQLFMNAALTAAEKVVGAFAKIPGPQQKAMQSAAQAIKDFRSSANENFDKAIGKLNDWDRTLKNMPKVAKLQGDIKDLESKIATAKEKLKDPKLTATQRATLTANITALQKQVNAAKTKLDELKDKKVTITTTNKFITERIVRQQSGASGGRVPTFHSGGIMPGAPGTEGLALLQAGERITPAGRSGAGVTVVVNGALDPVAVARQVQQILLNLKRTTRGELGLA